MNNAANKLKISKSIKNKNGNNLVYPYITPNTIVNFKPSNSPVNLSGNVIIASLKNRDLIEIKEFKVGHTYVCENPYAKKNFTFSIIKMDEPQYFVDNNFRNISYNLKTNVYSISCEIFYNRPQIDGKIHDNNIARAVIYSNKDEKTLNATIYNDKDGNPLNHPRTVAKDFPIIGEIPQTQTQTQLFGGRRKSRKSRKSRKPKKVNT